MDIQKEREAFEAWFESRYDAHFMQFAIDLDMYADKHTQTCWEAWQAAKAIPDGFVVVPEEPTERMLDSAYSSISDNLHYADLENIYKAMIWSAQEQDHESK